jgi:hypothetical protein
LVRGLERAAEKQPDIEVTAGEDGQRPEGAREVKPDVDDIVMPLMNGTMPRA